MSHPDSAPQTDAFLRLYEIAARANLAEVEAELARIPAQRRIREPGALALRAVRSILQGDPQGGVALLRRTVASESGDTRAFLVDLLVPVLVTAGAYDEAEEHLAECVDPPEAIAPSLLAARAALAARTGRDAESRAFAGAALTDARLIDWPIMVARVMQRVSLAAFYREDFGEAQERGLEAARMHERLDSFRTAALAYSVLYVIAYSSAADLDMARFYAERVSLNAKRGGDESMQNYGLVLQLHIAAESGDRRRLGSIRARLMANPMHEQYRERLAFIISEALLAGWSERFDSATAALVSLQDGEVRIRGDRALCTALLSLAAAANWKLDEARRLARRAISESVQQRGHEAKFETRARVIARFLASATCYLVGDASRGQRALSAAFDPQGIFRASLSANGVDPAQIPPLMRGYALYVNAAFASARRFVPVHGLTQVENEVLRVLPTGVTIARIAADRGKSRKTIERQVESIYAKFGVRNRIEAINKARELGILK